LPPPSTTKSNVPCIPVRSARGKEREGDGERGKKKRGREEEEGRVGKRRKRCTTSFAFSDQFFRKNIQQSAKRGKKRRKERREREKKKRKKRKKGRRDIHTRPDPKHPVSTSVTNSTSPRRGKYHGWIRRGRKMYRRGEKKKGERRGGVYCSALKL